MDVKTAKELLAKLQEKMYAYGFAENAISFDALTAAPSGSASGRGRAMAILSENSYNLFINDEVGALISFLAEHAPELDPITSRQVEKLKLDYDEMTKIPVEEYIEYSVLLNDADAVWHSSKEKNDFAAFLPYLEKIIAANQKLAGYFNAEKAPYDVLLDRFEQGACMESLDKYFAEIRAVLVPLIRDVASRPPIDDSFLYLDYPIDKQRELSNYLMEVLGIDRTRCSIGETEHPFTLSFNKNDARITTHYFKNNFISSLYSVIHESGHAIYDMGCDDMYEYTCLAGGVSMGIHESQSRFYENVIGRSEEFVSFIFPKLCQLFPDQLKNVGTHAFYLAVNKVCPSLIRTEADELTYSMHIMIRYELEKHMMDGSLAVKDIPAAWNALYKEYLGVDVPDDKHGVLQDVHWSGGSIGYFPSYSLGSAYAAQMIRQMEREFDVWGNVAKGNLAPVTEWLHTHIHHFGSFKKPADLLRDAVGGFDPSCYSEYLAKKFGA